MSAISPPPFAWRFTVQAHELARWRAEVADAVRLLGGDVEAVAAARLGVSELLGNVLRHVTDQRCRMEVSHEDAHVCVRVFDRSPDAPAVRAPRWDAAHGRGLWLVREMVATLGHTYTAGGKWVWFHVRVGTGSRDDKDTLR
ncbi:ATP-binding protein [Streptomyces sp. OF3]|uniref:ATP-binding protein n=1 Tax=Streptomyces alkaliterrae TaxID=2213162 RepID=A0A7W3WLL7_9ACTN|nr:ATP-binding protein [Streptomyces alkaliterrae]MBB1254160.1 ATP-binding protein [Streptomyces alkaliterrae]